MKTRIYDFLKLNDDEREAALLEAARLIKAGETVVFPTETVYGIGANGLSEEAVEKIYTAKGRPSDNPLILHVNSFDMLKEITEADLTTAEKLAEEFWPGPLTIILKKSAKVPERTTGGLETVAVRMPKNHEALKLLEKSGVPVAAPSANVSGRPSPTRSKHVIEDMDGKVSMIIAGDSCEVGIESTILDLTQEVPMILRPGMISKEDIERTLGMEILTDKALERYNHHEEDVRPKAPGMKYRHYAPRAEMAVFIGDREKIKAGIEKMKNAEEKSGKRVGVILFGEKEYEQAAYTLFDELRKMDEEKVDLILAGALDVEDGRGEAVMNRMLKSAGYNIIKV